MAFRDHITPHPQDVTDHEDHYSAMDLPVWSNSSATDKRGNEKGGTAVFEEAKIYLIPMPTADPRDPLNLPNSRKIWSILALSLFGAMAASAELILGAVLPVFSFEYADLDPKLLVDIHLPAGSNGLAALAQLPGPPIWEIYLLASAPVLTIGIANFFLVPLAIAVGRRTVLLGTGVIALAGCVGSGFSVSLGTHLVCRVIQALGAGTIESLIPFIIQDMVFYHQRSAAIAFVFLTQGLSIVVLGIASPYIIGRISWRFIYFVTAGAGLVFLIQLFFVLPETKFARTDDELRGIPKTPLLPGQTRPNIDRRKYPARTRKADLQVYRGPADWRAGRMAIWDSLRTFFYPQLFFITMLNSAVIAVALAAGYTVAPQLITEPWSWPFYHLGFCLFPIILASLFSMAIAGVGADMFTNYMAKKRGQRLPEFQVLNLIFPCVAGLVGCVLFGLTGDHPDKYHWMIFLVGIGLIAFSFLATNTIGIVYVLESHPHLSGPSLVNIASFRCLIAFVLSFRVSEWVTELGYLKTFTIYAGVLGVFILFIPVVYIYGPRWRERWSAEPRPTTASSPLVS
ncbi:hypothetical protein QQS21_010488 [Conoideocrella luteorostrata]|uniref:Major facilitator superfamily (MFS) profile domain-containing protein n=1 Tax=Conoideocrella luteorostrata TaxID=1105319 RepID=A0AAJ0CF80_9HYPO|nr:hypothetical protein QQS21_010488 [Conoideocrella luteorostrata]